MNSGRDIERLLGEFFADGPSSLPAEAHRAILAQVATRRQRGRRTRWVHGHWAGLPSAAWAAVVVGIAAVVIVATIAPTRVGPRTSPAPAGNAVPPAAPTTHLDTRTAPASWATFRSSRFGYTLRHPAGFLTSEVPGSPMTGSLLNAPGTDQLSAPGVAQVGIDRLAVAADASLAAWRAQAVPRDARCANPEGLASVTVAGEAGIVDVGHCWGRYVLTAYVLHGGYGYEVYWTSPGGNETADLATFLQLLGSVQFVP